VKLQSFIRALGFSVLLSSSLVALAAYPDRPVTIIIGFPPEAAIPNDLYRKPSHFARIFFQNIQGYYLESIDMSTL
jgi:hypothetical protein